MNIVNQVQKFKYAGLEAYYKVISLHHILKNIMLLFFILFSLSGCSGCGYFYLKFEDLDKKNQSSDSQNPPSDTTPENNSGNNQNVVVDNISSLTLLKTLSKSAELTWVNPNANGSVLILYKVGSDAPTDCSLESENESLAKSTSSNSIQLGQLLSDTTYSARVCWVSDQGQRSSGVVTSFKTLYHLNVGPFYPAYPNWNDYLENDGTTAFNASGAVCNLINYEAYNSCLHGGIMQKAQLPSGTLCSQVKVSDALDAFIWKCIDGANPYVVSSNFKSKKGLADLVTTSNFLDNYIIIKINNTPKMSSEPAIWWQNPVAPLPVVAAGTFEILTNSQSGVGTIFVNDQTRTSGQIKIGADKISLVSLNGSTLKTASSPVGALVTTSGSILLSIKNIWIEGSYNGLNLSNLIDVKYVSLARLHNLQLADSIYGIDSFRTQGLYIDSFQFLQNTNSFFSSNTFGVIFNNGFVNNSGPINFGGSSSYNLYLNNILFNSIEMGLGYPDGAVINRMTFANSNNDRPVRLANNQDKILLQNILMLNNFNGFYMFSGGGITYSQIASGGNSNQDFYFGSEDDQNKFTNNLLLTTAASCLVGNSFAGISNTCTNVGPSDATINKTLDVSKVFRGPITIDDPLNSSDGNGSQLFSQILDWFNFSSIYRSWSRPTIALPDAQAQGACTSGTCQIFDYRLNPSVDNLTYNNSAFNSLKNSSFVANATCPSAVHGNEVTTADIPTGHLTFTNLTFLTHAEEIFGDLVGNDNFLCESGEECIYTPNFGAYQGEGDYLENGPCNFENGVITNVKMFAYPQN